MTIRIWKIFKLITIAAAGLLAFHANVASANERGAVPEYRVFGKAASAADEKAVDTLLSQFKAAWARQDTAGVMALYADDIEWINAYARIFRGKEALTAFLRDTLFPNFAATVSVKEVENMKAISLRYIGDSVAVYHGYTDGNRGSSVVAGRDLRRTHFHFVMEKRDGQWKFVHKAISDAR